MRSSRWARATAAALLVACLALCGAAAFATPIQITTATTAQLVAPVAGQAIHVTAFSLTAGGSTTAKLVYGTQTTTPCDTGQTALTGLLTLSSGGSVSAGAGSAILFIAPAGAQLCIVQTGAVQLGGFVSYTQY